MPDIDRLSLIRAAARPTLQTPWKPVTEKLRELWTRWLWDTQGYPERPPRLRTCPRCARRNPAGDPATAWLCLSCLNAVKSEDAGHPLLPVNDVAAPAEPVETDGRCTSSRHNVMEAARSLRQPFDLAQLVVAVWKANRERWGLAGYELEYPDAHKIRCVLYGRTGPLTRGWLRKRGECLYEVAK